MGKIQVLKSLIIPKFLYRLTNISYSDEIIKEINKVMYHFIWNGKDKIKHSAIINDIENGSLRMTHLDTAIQTQRIMFLKRYASNDNRAWKDILDSCLKMWELVDFFYNATLTFQSYQSVSQCFIRSVFIPDHLW